MRVLVSGATGMVGTVLGEALEARGHQVLRLVRKTPTGEGELHWDPASGHIDRKGLAGVEAVVHLAGENVGSGYWTRAKKARILESRELGTRLLAGALAQLELPPKVFLSASAVGIYGSRGGEDLDESSGSGDGFLAEVCRRWEGAASELAGGTTRMVFARLGVILSPEGGALAKMLLPFRMALGGVIGTGDQFMSWVGLPDVVEALIFLLEGTLEGPVNLVAPEPVTNRTLTKTLGKVLGRPTIVPLPAFAARLVMGEMAEEMLLASQKVRPAKLLEAGFEFRHPDLEGALRAVL